MWIGIAMDGVCNWGPDPIFIRKQQAQQPPPQPVAQPAGTACVAVDAFPRGKPWGAAPGSDAVRAGEVDAATLLVARDSAGVCGGGTPMMG